MKEYQLSQLIEIKHGYAFDGEHIVTEDNGVVLVTPGNFKIGGGFQEEKCKFFTGEIPEEYILSAGDYIVTMTDLSKTIDTLGYSAIVPQSKNRTYLHNQRIGLIKFISDECDPDYIYYLMQTHKYQRAIANTSTGATVHHTSPSKIREYKFSAPDVQIQRRVAKTLRAYDDLIENNQKQIKLLEEAAQRLYKEWFVDLRFPGYENTPLIDGVPQGWRLDIVKSVVSLLSGYAFKSSDFVDNGKYSIVTIKNVQDGNFDGENVNTIAEIPSKMPSYCILNNGDILLSLTGNVGRVCLVNGDNYLLNQRVAKLDSKYPAYAYCLFRNKDMFDIMSNLANGAAQQNLSPIRTENVRILIPSDSLIQKLEDIVSPMIAKMLVLNKSNSNLKQARDRLLPKLMSGELEV